ncbi:MAG: 4Fe-4S binding protein, partial [Melioribacteraceae bacterium]|nr:4Fe-4S binding protein [Melioribacteraceae bacterium]
SLFNNLIVFILESFEIYSLYPVTLGGYTLFGFLFVLSFSSLLIWLSLFHGRLYCNTICPVGTLLGYISKLSFMKIRIDDTNCTGCGICEIKCKGSCIDSDNKYVDHSRCVSCFNCLTVCPSHGIIYSSRIPKKLNLEEKNKTDYDKRNFIGSLLIFSIGLSSILKAQEKIKVFVKNKIKVIRENPITPPGAVSNEGFTEKCTACHLCVSKCPTKVLQPSFLEYGFIGMLQPRMDNFNGFCNYECTICGEVCPTGAIEPVILEEKKLIQIGKAKFIKDNCIVFTQKTDCGACAEHCPTKAVKMLYDEVEKVVAPKIDDKICIGCGACEYACPTQPYKAIYVEANTVHAKAEKPSEEPMEEVILEEFPF